MSDEPEKNLEQNSGGSSDAAEALNTEASTGKTALLEQEAQKLKDLKAGLPSGISAEFGKPLFLGSDSEEGEGAKVARKAVLEAEEVVRQKIKDEGGRPSEKDKARDARNEDMLLADKYEELDEERERLDKAAEANIKDPKELAAFKDNMQTLQDRETELTEMYQKQYEKQGLNPHEAEALANKRAVDEIKDTMAATRRILEATGDKPMKADAREQVAKEVMLHAADPTTINQGRYGTCQAAAPEARMYARDPSIAANMVADVATTGEFTAGDGTHVKLHPDNLVYQTGDRDFASQLYQTTAIQCYYEKNYGNVDYICTPGQDGHPDHFIDRNTGKEPLEDDGSRWVFGGYGTEWVAKTNNIITGREEFDIGLTTPPCSTEPYYASKVESEQQLDEKLAQLKKEGKLPVVVWVNSENEPFYNDSGQGSAGGSGGGHYVTVTDYAEGTPSRVEIDNSWGSGADHLWKNEKDQRRGVTTGDLYKSMHDPEQSCELLKKECEQNREEGEVDHFKELECSRMERKCDKMTDAEYGAKVREQMEEMQKHRKMKCDANEVDQDRKLEQMINTMPADERYKCLLKARETGLMSEEKFNEEVADATVEAIRTRDTKIKDKSYNDEQKANYKANAESFEETLKELPEAQQKKILDDIAARTSRDKLQTVRTQAALKSAKIYKVQAT